MTRTIEGGCLCGQVRYRIDGEPIASVTCQCRSCRKASAAPVVPWLHLDAGNFAFTAGRPLEFRSSPPVIRSFCGRCGSPLTYWSESYGNKIDVTTCSLDDPEAFPPARHVWASHGLSWVKLADGLPSHAESTPSS
jgi:hypothetical protein